LVSCKPTSTIITSKIEAEKRGIYTKPETKVNTTKKVSQTNLESTKTEKKVIRFSEFKRENTDFDYLDLGEFSDQLVQTATNNIGSPYKTGGTTQSGFDCSGLMYSTFKNYNITLPRTSNEMSRYGRTIDRNEIKKGDLIFFKTLGSKVVNHVGMVVEINDEEIKFVHSSIKKGVIISSTQEDYYKKTFSHVNRVLE